MSDAADVIATRLRNCAPHDAETLRECAAYVRVGGALTRALCDAAAGAIERSASPLGAAAAIATASASDTPVFGGAADAVVGQLPARAAASDTPVVADAAAVLGGQLELLQQLATAATLADVEQSALAPLLGERLARRAIERAHAFDASSLVSAATRSPLLLCAIAAHSHGRFGLRWCCALCMRDLPTRGVARALCCGKRWRRPLARQLYVSVLWRQFRWRQFRRRLSGCSWLIDR